jgi:UPF0176 protein
MREPHASTPVSAAWNSNGRTAGPRTFRDCPSRRGTRSSPSVQRTNLRWTRTGVVGGGTHLSPKQVNELVEREGDDVVFFDGRNAFEAQIGRFKNAIVPSTRTTHDFLAELESGKYDDLKSKKVVTYCTGGIRCEILSALMKNRGFEDVYQIDGGIVRYGEEYGDSGLWEGSLYVFDARMHMEFTPDAVTIGECESCGAGANRFENCSNQQCRDLILLCPDCRQGSPTCPDGCASNDVATEVPANEETVA